MIMVAANYTDRQAALQHRQGQRSTHGMPSDRGTSKIHRAVRHSGAGDFAQHSAGAAIRRWHVREPQFHESHASGRKDLSGDLGQVARCREIRAADRLREPIERGVHDRDARLISVVDNLLPANQVHLSVVEHDDDQVDALAHRGEQVTWPGQARIPQHAITDASGRASRQSHRQRIPSTGVVWAQQPAGPPHLHTGA
jgi:hypothetical protein